MQFAQYTLPDFCRFSSGISPEIRSANVCVSIFSQIYLVFLISGVKKAYRFRHFRQSPPLSGFFPVFRPPSRLFPQGSGGMLRQRQPPLLMRSLHCAFQPGDSHASDVGYWLGMTRDLKVGFRAAPRNSARSLSQDFCLNSKFGKRRNTVCISACQKSLAEFAARRRQRDSDHFLSGRVPGRKYNSGCKCAICTLKAYKSCAQQTAILLSKKGKALF